MPINTQTRKETQVAVSQVATPGSTDLVAAPAGMRIHVTAMCLTLHLAGTLKFTEGTGPTDVTGAMNLAAGTPLELSSGGGQPILRTNTAGNKLSITTATGAANGWIRYFIDADT